MYKLLNSFRYFALIGVLCSMLGAVLMFGIGASKSYDAYRIFLTDSPLPAEVAQVARPDLAMKRLVQSVDAFLFALVLMIFSIGVLDLFIKRIDELELPIPAGLRVSSIGDLKSALAEVILIILFVKFLELVLTTAGHLPWEALSLPLGVLALALGLKLLGLREHPASKDERKPG